MVGATDGMKDLLPPDEPGMEEIRQILIGVARARKKITYSKLCDRVTSRELHPHSRSLWRILGQISISEDRERRGLLSALVVNKDTNIPGNEFFFEIAANLRPDISGDFLYEEQQRVYAAWASPQESQKTPFS